MLTKLTIKATCTWQGHGLRERERRPHQGRHILDRRGRPHRIDLRGRLPHTRGRLLQQLPDQGREDMPPGLLRCVHRRQVLEEPAHRPGRQAPRLLRDQPHGAGPRRVHHPGAGDVAGRDRHRELQDVRHDGELLPHPAQEQDGGQGGRRGHHREAHPPLLLRRDGALARGDVHLRRRREDPLLR